MEQIDLAIAMIGRRQVAAARAILRDGLASGRDIGTRTAAAKAIIQHGLLQDFRPAVAALSAQLAHTPDDRELLETYAYGAWATGDYGTAMRAARAALSRDPDSVRAMQTLAWAHLSARQPLDAYLVLAAMAARLPPGAIDGWRNLARRMTLGETHVEARLDDVSLRFELRTDTTSMVEAALHHANGMLTEAEELRLVRRWVGRAKTLVEVGTLVGNHLAYFLKTLSPERAIVFDIDRRSIAAARANIALNQPYPSDPALDFRHQGVAQASGSAEDPAGGAVELVTLDDAISEPVHFLKIDVDGPEIGVLQGARRLIGRSQPKIMIEIAAENEEAFLAFLAELSYRTVQSVDHQTYRNYLIEPR